MQKLQFLVSFILIICCLSCTDGDKRKLINEAPLISKTFTDDAGRKITLPKTPDKVISIAPNITEIIYAIGASEKLVARSQACDYPKEVKSIPHITTYPQLDMEALVATKAELVIATDELFSPDAIAAIENLGIPVYQQSYSKLSDVYKGIRDLGNILGYQKEAAYLADSLQYIEKRIIDSTHDEVKYRTLILVSNDPLIVVGGTGYLSEMIPKAGGFNIYEKATQPYVDASIEELLTGQPEYLIIPSKDPQIYASLVVQHPILNNLPASLLKQVYIVDPDIFYRPGPRTIDALAKLTNILHSPINTMDFFNAQ